MTKLKLCAKMYIFIIVSAVVIAAGLIVGAIFQCTSGKFFNYGGEFASYNSVTVKYSTYEYSEDEVKELCGKTIGAYNAYEVSYEVISSDNIDYKLIVYKYTSGTGEEKLRAATEQLNTLLKNGDNDSSATMRVGTVEKGGAKAVIMAAIAVSAAVVFQFVYFVLRYKLRAAFSALLACVHNLGLFVALVALTRLPVGAELTALCVVTVVLTMIFSGLFLDRVRKNFKDTKYEKTPRVDVIELSASETRLNQFVAACAVAGACLIFGVFAAISSLYIGAFVPYVVAMLGAVACGYGSVFFTPSVHGGIDATCEKVLSKRNAKSAAKPSKAVKSDSEPVDEKA